MIAEDIESGWMIFNQMPTGLQMQKIINIVGDGKWREFLDKVPEDASEFAIVVKARKRFEGEMSEFFVDGVI